VIRDTIKERQSSAQLISQFAMKPFRSAKSSAGSFALFGARKRHSVQASAGGRKFHRVVL
jgi:hypothetical protein